MSWIDFCFNYFLFLSVVKGILKKSSFVQAIENLVVRIRKEPAGAGHIAEDYPSLEFVSCAAALAHHGLLGPVNYVRLGDVDLSTVPTEHLVSLVSRATMAVMIGVVSGCDPATLIDNLKCEGLGIAYQCLGREETQALVRKMEFDLEWVDLDWIETLDIKALAKYSGWGCCWLMGFSRSFSDKFFDDLMTWASRKNWLLILTTPKEVTVEDKIKMAYRVFLVDDLKRSNEIAQISEAVVTISFVNSASPLAKKNDESSLTINLGEVSGLGLNGLLERLGLAGNISESKPHMVTLVKEAAPVEEKPTGH